MTDTHKPHSPDQLVGLSEVCAELDALGLRKPSGGFRALQTGAASAQFPVIKRNGRWYVRRADLGQVAASYRATSTEAAR